MRIFLQCSVIAILVMCGVPLAFAQPDLGEAERLIRAGKAEDAYNILQPYEFEMSGDVDFDYMLGLAALESGRPDQATLAFERVLAQDPNFLGARLDLARAWYALNLYDLAREELLQLQELNPPPAAQKSIDTYLALIERGEMRGEGVLFSGYLEARIGHDTNVNAAPGTANIYVPAFGGTITLNPSSTGTGDNYVATAAGFDGTYRSASGFTMAAGVEGADRRLQDATSFNTSDLKGRFSAGQEWGRFAATLGVQYNRMYLDNTTYRSTPSLGVDLRWAVHAQHVLFLFGQHIRQRYNNPANQPNDADINLAGAGYAFALDARGETQCFVSGYGGGDAALMQRADGNKTFYGVKAGVKHAFAPKLEGQVNLGFQHGTFDKTNPLFLVKRSDDIQEAGVGLVWQFAKAWSLRPVVSYFRSNSNVAIYDYDRVDYSAAVRYAF